MLSEPATIHFRKQTILMERLLRRPIKTVSLIIRTLQNSFVTPFIPDSLNNMNLLTGNDLLLSQIKGQFLKKMLSSLRSWGTLIIQNVIPIFFVIMSFAIIQSVSQTQDPLKISLDSYKETVTVLEGNAVVDPRVQAYQNLLNNVGGSHRLETVPNTVSEYILEKVNDTQAQEKNMFI